MDFQEQSKKDRERYESQRQEFAQKKHEKDDANECGLQHSLLETIKNRAKIIQHHKDLKAKVESGDESKQIDSHLESKDDKKEKMKKTLKVS